MRHRRGADRRNDRVERERRYQAALIAYQAGDVTTTETLIAAGMASRAVRLAYRFPRLFGRLSPIAAADRLRPIYAPEGGWRTVGIPSSPDPWSESNVLGRGFGDAPRPPFGGNEPLG